MVPVTGIEPVQRVGPRDFKSLVSTNSTTPAGNDCIIEFPAPSVKCKAETGKNFVLIFCKNFADVGSISKRAKMKCGATGMIELVDTQDLGSSAKWRVDSSPTTRIN